MKKFRFWQIFLIILFFALLLLIGDIYFSGLSKSNQTPTPKILPSPSSENENCENIPFLKNNSLKLVTKVIDGDTFLIEGGYSVRILGIDTDERGYPCYLPAKEELEKLILGKKVRLEKGFKNLDRYCRYLRYVFVDKKNVSLEMVKSGLAVVRLPLNENNYQKELQKAEEFAKENKIGCKWSGKSPLPVFEKENNKRENLTWQRITPEKLNLKLITDCQSKNYINKEVIVEGEIVDSYRSSKSNTVFLNFKRPYPNQCLTGVIFSSSLSKFPQKPENYYLNKKVRIFGKIKLYKNKPEIILESPEQIEIGK